MMFLNLTPTPVPSAMLEKAEDADADDLAEKIFEKSEKELESAKKFVRANFRNDEQVMATSALAMRSAKHAYYVALEVEKLMGLKEEAAEERILYFESLIERINKKFDGEVVIGNSLYEQAGIVSQRVEALQDDYKKKSQLALSAQLLSTELKDAKPLTVEKLDDMPVEISDLDQPKLEIEAVSEDVSVPLGSEVDSKVGS